MDNRSFWEAKPDGTGQHDVREPAIEGTEGEENGSISIHFIVGAHIDREDLFFHDEKVQGNSVSNIDGYAEVIFMLPLQLVQAQ